MNRAKIFISGFALFLCSSSATWACAVCGGQSDSAMAKGMNWGIFSLLAVILPMLMGIAGFFVFLAKKSAQVASVAPATPEQILKND
jgi:hypothetical protein